MDIIVTGYAGYDGSLIIYNDLKFRSELLKRYPESYFRVFENEDFAKKLMSYERTGEIKAAREASEKKIEELFLKFNEEGLAVDSEEGGVLSALWTVLKNAGRGGEYSQKDIPILQQTIELSEVFGVNPYRLSAKHCRVWLLEDRSELMQLSNEAHTPFSVIGIVKKGSAIRRTDTEEGIASSLRRPEEDELKRLFAARR